MSRRRTTRRAGLAAALGTALGTAVLAAALLPGGPARAAAQAHERVTPPRPVLVGSFADPAVERVGSGYVGVATGVRAPRGLTRAVSGRWRTTGPALTRMPRWAAPGDVWAADLHRAGDSWLLYYSAPVAGLGAQGRCIGVAAAESATGRFRPLGDNPLVCPAAARTPAAPDQPADPTLPLAGVIDPSVYADAHGERWLLYKTDRLPSSIRILPLSDDGRRPRAGEVSRELLRSPGVLENPVLVARPEGYVMLLSEGDYTRCSYRTVWRRSPTLLDWSTAESGVLLDRAGTGLCGPGGADVAGAPGGLRVFLHAWTCRESGRPCRGFSWERRERRGADRSLYAARLAWDAGLPRVARWVRPAPSRRS